MKSELSVSITVLVQLCHYIVQTRMSQKVVTVSAGVVSSTARYRRKDLEAPSLSGDTIGQRHERGMVQSNGCHERAI